MIGVIIFLSIFIGMLFGLNYYFYNKISSILFKLKRVWLFGLVGTLSMFFLMMIGRFIQGNFTFYLTQILYYYLGILAMTLIVFVWYDIIKLFFKKNKKYVKYLQIIFCAIFVVTIMFSIYQFEKPITVNNIYIESDKVSKNYTLLQITDTQYGSVGKAHLKKIRSLVDRVIDEENVDYILFTGDMIDTDNFVKEDMKYLYDFGVPTYFALGNHEFYHDSKILKIVDEEYILLRNESVEVEDLRIIGIDDGRSEMQVRNGLRGMDLSDDKYNILMYHRPTGVLDAKNLGIDLMLTGHTHGGQIFPATLIVSLIYPQGEVRLDDFVLYTSDGVGLWGPKFRLGSENEITVFHISNG